MMSSRRAIVGVAVVALCLLLAAPTAARHHHHRHHSHGRFFARRLAVNFYAIREACRADRQAHCAEQRGRREMRCLLDQFDRLSPSCKTKLAPLKACHEDAKTLCPKAKGLGHQWHCLRKQMDKVSASCRNILQNHKGSRLPNAARRAARKAARQAARKAREAHKPFWDKLPKLPKLPPGGKIIEACMKDRSRLCSSTSGFDQLMDCFANHESELSTACKDAVGPALACHNDAKKFCPSAKGFLETAKCLHGHIGDVSASCKAAMGDVKIPHPPNPVMPPIFKALRECRADAKSLCDGQRGMETIKCLADHEQDLSSGCRDAMKPLIACHKDANRLCANAKNMHDRMSCLKQHENELSSACADVIRRIPQPPELPPAHLPPAIKREMHEVKVCVDAARKLCPGESTMGGLAACAMRHASDLPSGCGHVASEGQAIAAACAADMKPAANAGDTAGVCSAKHIAARPLGTVGCLVKNRGVVSESCRLMLEPHAIAMAHWKNCRAKVEAICSTAQSYVDVMKCVRDHAGEFQRVGKSCMDEMNNAQSEFSDWMGRVGESTAVEVGDPDSPHEGSGRHGTRDIIIGCGLAALVALAVIALVAVRRRRRTLASQQELSVAMPAPEFDNRFYRLEEQ